MIAPMVAARDRDVAFIVLLAGPGVPGDSLLVLQNRALLAASGGTADQLARSAALNRRLYDAVKGARDSADAMRRLRAVVQDIVSHAPKEQRGALSAQLTASLPTLASPWMRYFLSYDPRPGRRTGHVPVLALNGTLDVQVPYRENLAAIDGALTAGGDTDHRTMALPGLNHLFQPARTGLPSEYPAIDVTIAPAAIDAIATWINARFGGVRKDERQ
jgi:hypothetical protein